MKSLVTGRPLAHLKAGWSFSTFRCMDEALMRYAPSQREGLSAKWLDASMADASWKAEPGSVFGARILILTPEEKEPSCSLILKEKTSDPTRSGAKNRALS
jgi:hypothetical protein